MKKLLAILMIAAATCKGVDVSYCNADLTWTGTGATSSVGHTIHGRIPAQPKKPQGIYTDTVIVTISFL